MPIETVIVLACIICFFGVFAVTLGWTAWWTQRGERPDANGG